MEKSQFRKSKTLVAVQQRKNQIFSKSALIINYHASLRFFKDFARKPKPSSSSLLPVIVVNDEEISQCRSSNQKQIGPAKQRKGDGLLEKKHRLEGQR